jgi:hypothetical protein
MGPRPCVGGRVCVRVSRGGRPSVWRWQVILLRSWAAPSTPCCGGRCSTRVQHIVVLCATPPSTSRALDWPTTSACEKGSPKGGHQRRWAHGRVWGAVCVCACVARRAPERVEVAGDLVSFLWARSSTPCGCGRYSTRVQRFVDLWAARSTSWRGPPRPPAKRRPPKVAVDAFGRTGVCGGSYQCALRGGRPSVWRWQAILSRSWAAPSTPCGGGRCSTRVQRIVVLWAARFTSRALDWPTTSACEEGSSKGGRRRRWAHGRVWGFVLVCVARRAPERVEVAGDLVALVGEVRHPLRWWQVLNACATLSCFVGGPLHQPGARLAHHVRLQKGITERWPSTPMGARACAGGCVCVRTLRGGCPSVWRW